MNALSTVKGIQFHESIAPIVQELVESLEREMGQNYCFLTPRQNQIKFALRLPSESKGSFPRAYRLFLMIRPSGQGALAVRPRIPKAGDKRMVLTATTLHEVHKAALGWLEEVKQRTVRLEPEPKENKKVMAGGQFESKRSKH